MPSRLTQLTEEAILEASDSVTGKGVGDLAHSEGVEWDEIVEAVTHDIDPDNPNGPAPVIEVSAVDAYVAGLVVGVRLERERSNA